MPAHAKQPDANGISAWLEYPPTHIPGLMPILDAIYATHWAQFTQDGEGFPLAPNSALAREYPPNTNQDDVYLSCCCCGCGSASTYSTPPCPGGAAVLRRKRGAHSGHQGRARALQDTDRGPPMLAERLTAAFNSWDRTVQPSVRCPRVGQHHSVGCGRAPKDLVDARCFLSRAPCRLVPTPSTRAATESFFWTGTASTSTCWRHVAKPLRATGRD